MTRARRRRSGTGTRWRRARWAGTRWGSGRIIVGTNRDLLQLVRDGQFREDLYYRLAARRVELPPLRTRVADLPVLVEQILDRLDTRTRLTPAALCAHAAHPWPGNVRELAAVLETAAVWSTVGRSTRETSRFSTPLRRLEWPPS